MVDDLLQDVFVKIHSRIDTLQQEAKLESWLYQITRNTIIDHYRSQRAAQELPDWIAQPQPEQEELVREELAACLEPMIRELPDKYRKAVWMSVFENKTQQEVAEQAGISLSGAKSRVQRGRGLLKAMLCDCCQIEINRNNQVVTVDRKNRKCKYC